MIKLSFEELLKIAQQYRALEKKKPHFSTAELKDYLNCKKLLNQHNVNFEKVKTLSDHELPEYIKEVLESPELEKIIIEKANLNVIEKVEEKKAEVQTVISLSDEEYLTTIIQENIDGVIQETKKIRNEIKEDTEEVVRIVLGSKFKLEINNNELYIQIPKKSNIVIEPSLLIELYKKTFSSSIIEIEKQLQEPSTIAEIENETVPVDDTDKADKEEVVQDLDNDSIFEQIAMNVTLNVDTTPRKPRNTYKVPVGNVYYAPFNIARLKPDQYSKYYEPYRDKITGNTNEEIVAKIFDLQLVDGLLPRDQLKLEDVTLEHIIQLRLFAGLKVTGIVSVLKALCMDDRNEDEVREYIYKQLAKLPDQDIMTMFSSDVLSKVRGSVNAS